MGDKDILIVVSKLKAYVKEAHGMSTSGTVPAVLTDYVKKICAKGADAAQNAKRKTIMDRDFENASSDSGSSLVVVSKLKAYVKEEHGMSTSGAVPAVLTSYVKQLCSHAVEAAQSAKRKTIMDRDFENACSASSCGESENMGSCETAY